MSGDPGRSASSKKRTEYQPPHLHLAHSMITFFDFDASFSRQVVSWPAGNGTWHCFGLSCLTHARPGLLWPLAPAAWRAACDSSSPDHPSNTNRGFRSGDHTSFPYLSPSPCCHVVPQPPILLQIAFTKTHRPFTSFSTKPVLLRASRAHHPALAACCPDSSLPEDPGTDVTSPTPVLIRALACCSPGAIVSACRPRLDLNSLAKRCAGDALALASCRHLLFALRTYFTITVHSCDAACRVCNVQFTV